MCSAFLWSGSPNISTKSKVAWEEVCKPKDEEGLGIRRIKDVSAVFDLKLICEANYTTRGVLLGCSSRGSGLMDLEEAPSAATFGQGVLVYGWRLIEVIGERGTQKLGIVRNAKIADVLVDDQWRFRNSRDSGIVQVLAQIKAKPLLLTPNVDDGVKWKRGDVEYGSEFSAYSTWDMVRAQNAKVPWAKLIWFKQGVPRYAFITWLAVKDRLSTGSRMRTWGIIGSLLRPAPSPDWNEILARILHSAHDRLVSILLRLALQVMAGGRNNTFGESRGSSSGCRSSKGAGRFFSVPKKCWCGESNSDQNPYRRYLRCSFAVENKLHNDNHIFKWVDEALLNEVDTL
ncbi:uncharacterized protein LOC103849780 [Brassica rapa]|uniref:uncharacterized protein LOC103849780 n=1 Tax=Brassica campestris TaxID=3711 RepID=UPI00142E2781|nr:uncharacterized protein LOC103849780 [Brassica rapa]